jgi:hypothetical protein
MSPYGSDEYNAFQEKRHSQAFKDLLLKAMKTMLPRDKFLITYDYDGRLNYMQKFTKRHVFWTGSQIKAKVFDYKEDALNVISQLTDKTGVDVERV